jgi:hypothetical protein
MPEDLTRRPNRDFSPLDDVEVEPCWSCEFTHGVTHIVHIPYEHSVLIVRADKSTSKTRTATITTCAPKRIDSADT